MSTTVVRLHPGSQAPTGVHTLAATVFAPTGAPHALVTCVPGGGMNRGYFDLEVPGYSMAEHLRARGLVAVAIDPPGIGDSDRPDDPATLDPWRVGAMIAAAALDARRRLRDGTLTADLERADVPAIGLGHSAGAGLTVYAQAAERPFDALALLGFGGSGLLERLNETEAAFANDPAALRGALPALARSRFGTELPSPGNVGSNYLVVVPITDEVRVALSRCAGSMLGLVGLASMVPGSIAAELASIAAPVFVAVGDNDIAGPPHLIGGAFERCREFTLYVLPASGHNHNVAPTRALLWDRVADWVDAQVTTRSRSAPRAG